MYDGLSVGMVKMLAAAGHGGACLYFQHSRGRGRGIRHLRPVYCIRLPKKKRKKKKRTTTTKLAGIEFRGLAYTR